MKEKSPSVDFSLSVDDVRQLSKTIEYHCTNWAGSRDDVEEQVRIRRLRYMFRAALMEISYHFGEDATK